MISQVVFEPDPNDATKTTSLVATCGGNSICIIDVNSGTVLMKYKHKDIKENFYTLAWTTLKLQDEKTNILASGGIRGEIRMFHPASKVRKVRFSSHLLSHLPSPRFVFTSGNRWRKRTPL